MNALRCNQCQGGAPGYICSGCIDKLLIPKSKGGRPPAEPHLQRVNVPLRLPRWMVEWIDAQWIDGEPRTRADVIEAALLKAHKLKGPAHNR